MHKLKLVCRKVHGWDATAYHSAYVGFWIWSAVNAHYLGKQQGVSVKKHRLLRWQQVITHRVSIYKQREKKCVQRNTGEARLCATTNQKICSYGFTLSVCATTNQTICSYGFTLSVVYDNQSNDLFLRVYIISSRWKLERIQCDSICISC